jgi:hypothetical protein
LLSEKLWCKKERKRILKEKEKEFVEVKKNKGFVGVKEETSILEFCARVCTFWRILSKKRTVLPLPEKN